MIDDRNTFMLNTASLKMLVVALGESSYNLFEYLIFRSV